MALESPRLSEVLKTSNCVTPGVPTTDSDGWDIVWGKRQSVQIVFFDTRSAESGSVERRQALF